MQRGHAGDRRIEMLHDGVGLSESGESTWEYACWGDGANRRNEEKSKKCRAQDWLHGGNQCQGEALSLVHAGGINAKEKR
jgi:hypothetical protein